MQHGQGENFYGERNRFEYTLSENMQHLQGQVDYTEN